MSKLTLLCQGASSASTPPLSCSLVCFDAFWALTHLLPWRIVSLMHPFLWRPFCLEPFSSPTPPLLWHLSSLTKWIISLEASFDLMLLIPRTFFFPMSPVFWHFLFLGDDSALNPSFSRRLLYRDAFFALRHYFTDVSLLWPTICLTFSLPWTLLFPDASSALTRSYVWRCRRISASDATQRSEIRWNMCRGLLLVTGYKHELAHLLRRWRTENMTVLYWPEQHFKRWVHGNNLYPTVERWWFASDTGIN